MRGASLSLICALGRHRFSFLFFKALAALAEENKVALAAAIAEERAQGEQERATVLQECRAEIQREANNAQASANEQLTVQAKEHTEVLQRAADSRTAAVKVRPGESGKDLF